jgi:plastocyanin
MTKPRFRRTVLALTAGGLLLGVSGVGVADTAKVKARSNDTWKKVHTYIEKGDRVKWSNPDSEMHDVTFYRGSSFSAQLPPGDTVKKKFRKKGTALYRCTVHSGIVDGGCQGMCAFVHVS